MRTANPVRLQRIFDSAVCLFAERRFHEVRMDDIAARAGVSKGALYHHFKDKDDLYLEIVLRGLSKLLAEVRERIAETKQPEEKLRGFVHEGIRFFSFHPYYRELIEIAERSHSKEVEAQRAPFLDLLTGIFRELDASGKWAVGDPEFAARALLGMMREALRWRTPPASDLPDRVVHLILHGLRRD